MRSHRLVYKRRKGADDLRVSVDTDESVFLISISQTLGDDEDALEQEVILDIDELEEIVKVARSDRSLKDIK